MTPILPAGPTQEEAFARIRLLRSPGIGGATYLQLLARCGNAAADGGRHPDHAASPAAIHAEISAVTRAGARYIFHDSPDYPPLLRAADGAPPILVARGEAAQGRRLPVAMVGARNASAAAMRLAQGWARELADAGCTVVSGLARGIDTAAHRGALSSGAGGTIAVIASGIDIAYPPQNAALQQQIATEGLLLTEHPPGTQPVAHLFPARNRIIAGLACGTLVVEAAVGSGSLITARLAGEAGREVMAVPGSPLDARSRGCNALIRDGAVLVQGPEDILELITSFASLLVDVGAEPGKEAAAPHLQRPDSAGAATARPRHPPAATPSAPPSNVAQSNVAQSNVALSNDDLSDALAGLLSMAPVGIDELVRSCGAEAGAVQLALVELELTGRLARHPGGRVSLAG